MVIVMEIDMKNAKYYASGWGEGMTAEEAVKNSLKAAGTKQWRREGFEMLVYELDPSYPVTHIRDYDGHALHVPENAKPLPMGGHEGERLPYKRDAKGNVIPGRRFRYKKGAVSDVGKDLIAA
jgi:hypothetical protein